MLSRIEIRGFKAFSSDESVAVPLTRLTFLLGPNSSGKSSLFQALLALKQSWSAPGTIDRLSTRGHETDAGEFSACVFKGWAVEGDPAQRTVTVRCERFERGGKRSTLAFTYAQAPPHRAFAATAGILQVLDITHPHLETSAFRDGRASFVLRAPDNDAHSQLDFAQLDLVEQGRRDLLQLTGAEGLTLDALVEAISVSLMIPKQPDQGMDWSVTLDSAILEQAQSKDRVETDELTAEIDAAHALGDKIRTTLTECLRHTHETVPATDSEDQQDAALIVCAGALDRAVHDTLREHRRELVDVGHIGGLRERGHWSYPLQSADRPVFAGRHGERIADMLVQSEQLVTTTSRLFRYLRPDATVRFESASDGLQGEERGQILFDFLLDSASDSSDDAPIITGALPSLGTGVSQVFPIIVQLATALTPGFFARPPLFLIEQPELHLHPRLQARLARVLVDAAAGRIRDRGDDGSWEDDAPALGLGSGAQLLVETHSEHLILAVSNQIKDRELSHTDASILVIERDEQVGCSRIRRIEFDPTGELIGEWPGGFFEERFDLLQGEEV